MALSKVNYVDNQTIITAQNLNDIQNEIIQNTELIKKGTPRNLLDNSDFTNPVNRRGQTSYSSREYTIDRWFTTGNTINIIDGAIEIIPEPTCKFRQYLEANFFPFGKTVTFAVNTSEGLATNVVQIPDKESISPDTHYGPVEIFGYEFSIRFNLEGNVVTYGRLDIKAIENKAKTIHLYNAVLYEGAYTTETLPEYQSKGYENELLICYQYNPYTDEYIGRSKFSQPRNLLDNSDFTNPVNQREKTSYTLNAWGGYCIDRWRAGDRTTTLTINGNGCTLKGEIYQIIDPNGNAKGLNGKTVTIAAKVNGSIGCSSGTIKLTGKWTQFADFSIPSGRCFIYADSNNYLHVALITDDTVTIEWVALYEGETLPEYQSKGYAAELRECQRYYYKHKASTALFAGCLFNTKVVRVGYILPVPMIKTPSVDVSSTNFGKIDMYAISKVTTHPTAISVNTFSKDSTFISLSLNWSFSATSGTAANVRFNTEFSLIADL